MNGLENIISSYLGMKKMIRYHLENERLKRKINDLIDENENLKKSKKGFFSKLFG